MSDREPRHRATDPAGRAEEADGPVEDFENDGDEQRESLEREAGLSSFGGAALGPLFDRPDDEDGEVFDGQHNP